MRKVLGDLLLTAWAAREKFGSSRHGHGVEGGARSASKDWKLPTGRPSAGRLEPRSAGHSDTASKDVHPQ